MTLFFFQDREIKLCEQTIDILNKMNPKPAFFIVCGDLVDAMPDEWPQIRESQEQDFFRVFSKLTPDIPLVCVCGNHDVGKYYIHSMKIAQIYSQLLSTVSTIIP